MRASFGRCFAKRGREHNRRVLHIVASSLQPSQRCVLERCGSQRASSEHVPACDGGGARVELALPLKVDLRILSPSSGTSDEAGPASTSAAALGTSSAARASSLCRLVRALRRGRAQAGLLSHGLHREPSSEL
jgi:hypothetical protein